MTRVFFTPDMLSGKSRAHLQHLPCPFSANHFLQPQALRAFQALQKSAVQNGFNLQPASSFRDFQRQQQIWNEKFCGRRKVHDDQGNALNLSALSEWEKCEAILRWAALPGGSRHHWGTEIDIFDPDLLPAQQKLQLEPWEYEQNGYFFPLSQWLAENLPRFDFALPFMHLPAHLAIGREPWHISYLPVAEQARAQFGPQVLLAAWQNEFIAGNAVLSAHMPQIFARFFI